MNGDRWADVALYGLMLLLPLSSLLVRRLPIATTLKMAAAWAAIFAAAAVLVAVGREPAGRLWRSLSSGFSEQSLAGKTVRIRMAGDGHFWAMATINGQPRRMLVDSGASTTALSIGTAKAARIALDGEPFPALLDTANGQVIARAAQVRSLRIGDIDAHDLSVVVAPEFGDTDVIGMNFLSRLKRWRVEDRVLVLDP